MKISYYYADLISELKAEVAGGLLKLTDNIKIVRKDRKDTEYRPIIDWYYEYNDVSKEYEIENVGNVLVEMEEMNSLI